MLPPAEMRGRAHTKHEVGMRHWDNFPAQHTLFSWTDVQKTKPEAQGWRNSGLDKRHNYLFSWSPANIGMLLSPSYSDINSLFFRQVSGVCSYCGEKGRAGCVIVFFTHNTYQIMASTKTEQWVLGTRSVFELSPVLLGCRMILGSEMEPYGKPRGVTQSHFTDFSQECFQQKKNVLNSAVLTVWQLLMFMSRNECKKCALSEQRRNSQIINKSSHSTTCPFPMQGMLKALNFWKMKTQDNGTLSAFPLEDFFVTQNEPTCNTTMPS